MHEAGARRQIVIIRFSVKMVGPVKTKNGNFEHGCHLSEGQGVASALYRVCGSSMARRSSKAPGGAGCLRRPPQEGSGLSMCPRRHARSRARSRQCRMGVHVVGDLAPGQPHFCARVNPAAPVIPGRSCARQALAVFLVADQLGADALAQPSACRWPEELRLRYRSRPLWPAPQCSRTKRPAAGRTPRGIIRYRAWWSRRPQCSRRRRPPCC